MQPFRAHIARAVELKGSQAKLAADAGCSQQQISYLLNEAESITAEMAIAIDRATRGAVPKGKLRPDIFAPSREAAE
jgi:DNA-binding transcriptional regulator YdaS (Cro superfamily)